MEKLLISREEAERLRKAHGEARYRKERKRRITMVRKHLRLIVHLVDKLLELERSTKDPGPWSRNESSKRLLPRTPLGP